jgi:FtsH-binding integral membrane protein
LGTFVGSISVSLMPLLHIYTSSIIFDAMIATGAMMGSLGVVAYNSPSE